MITVVIIINEILDRFMNLQDRINFDFVNIQTYTLAWLKERMIPTKVVLSCYNMSLFGKLLQFLFSDI